MTFADAGVVTDWIVEALRSWFIDHDVDHAIVGSSGGIDSAVTIALCCHALGPKNVSGVRMPSKFTPSSSLDAACSLHAAIGCSDWCVTLPDDFVRDHIIWACGQRLRSESADQNLQARLRAVILMYFSNSIPSSVVVNTGNLTEATFGYSTLYGDSIGAVCPIGRLLKHEVYEIAEQYRHAIPPEIFFFPPSAQLAAGQVDEDDLLPYDVLDSIVFELLGPYKVTDWNEFGVRQPEVEVSQEDYERVMSIRSRNKFKRSPSPFVIPVDVEGDYMERFA